MSEVVSALRVPSRVYTSGVAAAEAAMGRKDVWSLDNGRPGFHDRDNFVTNRVTVAEFDDSRAYGAAAVVGMSATWACVRLIAETIGSLPLMVYRTSEEGERTVARDHPLYWLLHDSPNALQTAMDFWDFAAAAVELQGNAYALVERGVTGRVVALEPLRPDLVQVRRSGGGLVYRWTEGNRRREEPGERVLHVRGPGGGPVGGLSALAVCRSAFHGAVAAERASSAMFRNGVRPSGVLTTDTRLSPEQRTELGALLEEKFHGAMNAGRPMLLDGGLKWEGLSIDPADAQMLESRKFSVEEICRIFRVPPHMIGHTEKSTSWGSGIEEQTNGFVKFTLRGRLKRIEQALMKQLLTPADINQRVTIEFNLEGLLRGDSKGRAQFYREMTGIGAMTINEVRRSENLPKVEGGDVPRMQMQNVPITAETETGE